MVQRRLCTRFYARTYFVKHQDVSACKGHINAEYDSFKKQYYFWGECIVPKP